MPEPLMFLAVLILGIVAIGLYLHHHRGMAKIKADGVRAKAEIEANRIGADYDRGVVDGMNRAVDLLRSGAGAKTSGPYTPSPSKLADMVEATIPKRGTEAS